MAKRKDAGDAQPPLVPLTEDELKDAGHQLAVLEGELEEMETIHKAAASDNAKLRKKTRGRIKSLASQIRQQGR